MDPQRTVLSNFQNWQFRCDLDENGKIIRGSLHDPKGKNMTFEIGYVWNQNVKRSKSSDTKTLFRNFEAVKRENNEKAFETCKRPEGIYVVFGKTKLREDSLLIGGLAFVGGLALIASGAVLIAAPILGGGASTFIDAYKKDVVAFDKWENTKQGVIGSVTGIVTGCFSALFPVGAAASVGTKAAVSSASSTVGYITSAGLNGQKPTLRGTLTAIVAGGVAPVASSKMGNAFTMPAADQVDDLATALLVKSAAEGAVGAGASQVARNICEGKPLTEDLGISLASGTMTSVAGTIPKVMKILDGPARKSIPQGNSNPSEKTNQPAASSAPSSPSSQPMRAAAGDIWGTEISSMIDKGYRVLIDGKWEKPPRADAAYHQNNFLNRIANGEQLIFKKDGDYVTCGFTQVNNPADINHYIQKGWKFVLGGKLEKPPKRQGDFHSQNIIEGMQQKGEIIRIERNGQVRFLTTKPVSQPSKTPAAQQTPLIQPQHSSAPEEQCPKRTEPERVEQTERQAQRASLPEGPAGTPLVQKDLSSGTSGSRLQSPSSSSSGSEGNDGADALEMYSGREVEQALDLSEDEAMEEAKEEVKFSKDDLVQEGDRKESIEGIDAFAEQPAQVPLDPDYLALVLKKIAETQRRRDIIRLQSELGTIQNNINSLVTQLNNLEKANRHHRGQIFKLQKTKVEAQLSAEWSNYFQKEEKIKKLNP